MSILSELKKRAGPGVRFGPAPSCPLNSGGVPMHLVLAADPAVTDMFAVAKLLIRCGVPVRTTKRIAEELAAGRLVHVEAPSVGDYDGLRRAMKRYAVAVRQIALRSVDVKALRARLDISQEDFAGRYGLDVATVRNWEQGRTKPDGPAAALLQIIDRDPEKVVELLAS